MPHTQSFIVRTSDKRIVPTDDNPREYFTGKKKGKADMIIEVFGYNHIEKAKTLYNALKAANIQDQYFHIRIETRS